MTVKIVRDPPFGAQIYEIECAAHSHPWSRAVLESCQSVDYWRFSLLNDGQTLGFLIAHQVLDEVTLMNVAVAPQWQGQGYGRKLVAHLVAECKARQVTQIWLEVRASNRTAIQLYESLGFTQKGLRKGYYPAEPVSEDAVVMLLCLNSTFLSV